MSSQFSTIYEFGRFRLDRGNRRLTRDGLLYQIPDNTLQLLLMLVDKPDEVVSTEKLINRLLPKSPFGEEELASKVLELRRLLEDTSKENPMVRWMPGKGYRFEAPVAEFLGDAADDHLGGSKIETEPEAAPPEPKSQRKLGRLLGIAAAVILLTALGVLGWHFVNTGSSSKESSKSAGSFQIAVLPFASLSGAPSDESFDSALTTAVIDALAKGSQMRVAPAASVQGYTKSTPTSQLAAGRELGAQTIVVGMAQPLAGRVLVKVKMVRTEDEEQIWTGDFDGDIKDVAGLAARISERIAKETHAPEGEKPAQ